MSKNKKCFRLEYLAFSRKTVVKWWKMDSAGAVRTKAQEIGDCRHVVSITEVSEEVYAQRPQQPQRQTTQLIRVETRTSAKRQRFKKRRVLP